MSEEEVKYIISLAIRYLNEDVSLRELAEETEFSHVTLKNKFDTILKYYRPDLKEAIDEKNLAKKHNQQLRIINVRSDFLNGMKIKEISAKYGISESTISRDLNSGLENLDIDNTAIKDILKDHSDENISYHRRG